MQLARHNPSNPKKAGQLVKIGNMVSAYLAVMRQQYQFNSGLKPGPSFVMGGKIQDVDILRPHQPCDKQRWLSRSGGCARKRKMKRRNFLKLIGIGGAAALAPTALRSSVRKSPDKLSSSLLGLRLNLFPAQFGSAAHFGSCCGGMFTNPANLFLHLTA
jgi:hypothetical protein